jgi:uncharacterized integral membrane protein
MRFRSVPLVLVLLATAVFAVMNWTALSQPTMLSLGTRSVEAPIGMVMLGFVLLLLGAFMIYALSMHGSLSAESRRQSRELQVQRDLADKAEASRFTELRNYMSAELLRVSQSEDAMRQAILARLDALEQHSRTMMMQSANSLAASIGELEDRLERNHAITGNGHGPRPS